MSYSSDLTIRMEDLVSQWQVAADRRAIFLHCYLVMTRNMQSALDAGEFHDEPWVTALLQRFAGYYFDALDVYEQDQARAPAVWQITHTAAAEPKTHVLQNLMLGINAHINYDLVLALLDMLEPEWAELDEERRLARYRDHCHVNTIIGRSIDTVQDEVVEAVEPALDVIDRLFGRLDEWAASRLIASWREDVWKAAQRLLLAGSGDAREQVRREVEGATLRRANAILLRREPEGLRRTT
jgi:hypothetical protein